MAMSVGVDVSKTRRSSQGSARAGGRSNPAVDGGERKTAWANKDRDSSFDREAASHRPSFGAALAPAMSEVA